ncbi:ubiquinol-cytochrome-c reductase complex assembly factor 1 isoform X2 [Folsomia candida]|uniref:ubiquinol-cytochrome-c reductase complex assembly factor 1 isoform X2 n=1 Tax=Folsomia candida TaxID=158441 RepID=UPI0016053032|nr:ubiquinol-cytochrome-c reductase complex assembly factor 1 isoform X2 [Folsomia candida]
MLSSLTRFRCVATSSVSLANSYTALLNPPISVCSRSIHTASNSLGIFGFGNPHEEPLIKRIARKFGWSESSKSYLRATGYLMYIKVADEVSYLNFFKHCELEDTFISWFTVVELHLWLLGARIMQEGADGRVVRNSMFQALWEDCDLKSKKLDGALASARKRQILELGDQFQATLVSYDEGLLGNDVVLAVHVNRCSLETFFAKEEKHAEMS